MGRIEDYEIELEIYKKTNGLTDTQTKLFKDITDQTWARQYMRGSKSQLKKLTAKIKKGVKHGKYTYKTPQSDNGTNGKIMPKVKKGKKKSIKKVVKKDMMGKTIPEKKNTTKQERKPTFKSDKTKARVENARKKYPKATVYELRHGVNSAASMKYRERHGLPKPYSESESER